MIVTELYNGQGLGNQLWSYVFTRVLAKDKGFDFGIKSPEKFKGSSFMNLDFGLPVVGGESPCEGAPPSTLPDGIQAYYREKETRHANGSDITDYDPDLLNIGDNTKIDGYFQGEDYILHRKDEIREWLKVEHLDMPDDLCIINFRGGEYKYVPEFFLSKSYWEHAIAHMLEINPNMRFEVHTDDAETAAEFLPSFGRIQYMPLNWRSIRYAKYLILSNSSFAWFPAWLNTDVKCVIAPKYWGRHNISDGYWSMGYALTRGWLWQDREGRLQTYQECKDEIRRI